VQIGSADRRGVDPDDRIRRLLDDRVRNLVPGALTGTVVNQSLRRSSFPVEPTLAPRTRNGIGAHTERLFGFPAAGSADAPMPNGAPATMLQTIRRFCMKHILVATDGSENAEHAVDLALDFARKSGAEVTILYVRHASLPVPGEPFYQRAVSAELRHAQESAALAAARACAVGARAQVVVLEGNAAERIVELARLRDVDLIVVGSRGRGSIVGAIVGSVSREVVHHADRPVLVATPRASRRRAA
jgi:nucleotide-binding universal stress UspA family protein